MGRKVPDVLLSGHHENIAKWRRLKAIEETYNRRPDMLKDAKLTEKEKKYLLELSQEVK